MMNPSEMTDAQLSAELQRLRALKDQTISQLRQLVREHDDRVALAELRDKNPRLAARIQPLGVPSAEAFGQRGSV
jgi:hypothetical protein